VTAQGRTTPSGASGSSDSPSTADLEALASRYTLASRVGDELRDGFRQVKRAPREAKRLTSLLHGLTRKHEPDVQAVLPEIARLIAAIRAAVSDAKR